MNALYNEIEPYAANWLDNLIGAGRIADGRVERRSIVGLSPADVAGPGQRHFFAGIGGWSYALRLAGIPDDADVWTGSCPCQPFSDAGKRSGTRDARHLWPTWFGLIRECRPAAIFGEQVASRAGLAWFDAVRSDLEGCGYAVGASDLCAASVGAPHIRQRLYFVAYARGERREGERLRVQPGQSRQTGPEVGGAARLAEQLGNSSSSRSWRDSRGLPDAEAQGKGEGREPRRVADELVDAGGDRRDCACWNRECFHRKYGYKLARGMQYADGSVSLGDPALDELTRAARPRTLEAAEAEVAARLGSGDRTEHASADGGAVGDTAEGRRRGRSSDERREARGDATRAATRLDAGPWSNVVWLPCLDGKARPVEPGLEPLAHGVSKGLVAVRTDEQEHLYNRAGALAGFGNAIVPQVAAAFIEAAEAARRSLK